MQISAVILLSVVGFCVVAWLAWRDHARAFASRRDLLSDCRSVVSNAVVTHDGDGLPRLSGTYCNHPVHVALLTDTMTIRRLPQLWLLLTRLDAHPNVDEFSVLVRPNGTEFYSLTEHHNARLVAPNGFPEDCLARGGTASAQRLLDRLAPRLQSVLSDARIKEFAVTRKGLRLVWQAAEGRRGEHLLMRQSVFDDAVVSADELRRLADMLEDLATAIDVRHDCAAS